MYDDFQVNVIFAVTGNQVDTYKELATFIQTSVVGELANDSSNVVTLVRENYDVRGVLYSQTIDGKVFTIFYLDKPIIKTS